MDEREFAAQLIGLDARVIQPFDVYDPFNHQMRLEGYISLKPDHRYGALVLLRVGGAPVPQVILATPKLHYPFGRDGAFHFPQIQSVAIYEKLDGTNVCAYRYHDADGTWYTTYKLRLYPILRNGTWGTFLDMWTDMIAAYPTIPELAERNGCAVGMELYGAKNTHLVVYDVPLSVAVLFGIDADGSPRSPLALDTLGVPQPKLWGVLESGHDPVTTYNRIRSEMEATVEHLDEGKIKGVEGTVWYVTRPVGEVVLFKCKPESVEAVHWATGINREAVLATCWNVFETQDTLTYDTLLPLLQEEYTDPDIQRFRSVIDSCIMHVNTEMLFRIRVLETYRGLGVSFRDEKVAVLRALSASFRRQEMSKVFSILNTHG